MRFRFAVKKKTDKFGGFHLTEEKTFVRGEGEVVMGDQWELDAEDQMGDTLCICGKVFTKSDIALFLYFALC